MFGEEEARLSADIFYGSIETDGPVSHDEFVTVRRDSLWEVYQVTRETLGHAVQYQKVV